MKENIPLESAEERANRMWRNNHITRKLNAKDQSVKIIDDYGQPDWKKINDAYIAGKLRKSILEIFQAKRNDVIINYIAALKHQKRKLLLEKIKRLERDQ
jgi:hypothetical protein